jgi:hypothetical protein
MGKVTDHLLTLIAKQVDDKGIVVWYDPEKAYTKIIEKLSVPETTVLSFEDSFFRLREQIEPFLEFVDDSEKPKHDCTVPPRLIVYIPVNRNDTRYALVEVEMAGIVLEPGAHPWQRNTRLRVIAEQVFKKIAPDSAVDIARQVEEGILTLEELDKLSIEVEGIATGTVKIIFGTASAVDVALDFAASTEHDKAILAKQAMPELAGLFHSDLGIEIAPEANPVTARKTLWRAILMTELLSALPEEARPSEFSSMALPDRPEHVDKVLHLCNVWRNRVDYREAYIASAKAVESEAGLSDLDLPTDKLAMLETFPFLETALLLAAEKRLLDGSAHEAFRVAQERKNSFWSLEEPTNQLRWALVENSAQILILGERIRAELIKLKKSPELFVHSYTEEKNPWCLLDTYYRHLEGQYSTFDLNLEGEHDELEKVITRVRQDYTKTVEHCIEAFISVIEASDFEIKDYLLHRNVYIQHVSPHVVGNEKVAYILVDALRFEMGRELAEGLTDEFDVRLLPGIANLPTITTVGMAALMPGAENGMELVQAPSGKIAICIGSSTLKDRAGRLKYFEGCLNKKIEKCKLNDLIKPSKKRQTKIKDADVVLVTSQEIDRRGEEAEDEDETRLFMEEVLDKLRRGIRRLVSLGVIRFVITADHGHLFGETIESGMKMDPPGGMIAELHRRVWIGKGGKAEEGFVRVSANQLGLGGDLELAFPRSLACFKAGGSTAYFHGGISLQEMVIPVILLKPKEAEPHAQIGRAVKLSMDKPKVTTRFFSVTATYTTEGLFTAEEIRVKVAVRTRQKDAGFAAMSVYGFEEGTKEIVLQRNRPNPITFMLTDVGDVKSVSVHVLDAVSQLELARLEPIPVAITI